MKELLELIARSRRLRHEARIVDLKDHERAIVDIYPLSGVEESQVPELLEPLLVRHADDGQWVLVVTDRTSEVPVVRADANDARRGRRAFTQALAGNRRLLRE